MGLYSFLLFPGVFLHEFSHWFMAIILRVPVKNVSLLPKSLKNGKLRLGFVETSKSDFFRDSLIGLAPFISGSSLVAYIAYQKLELVPLVHAFLQTNGEMFFTYLASLPNHTDFGIWFYLVFAVSSTMLPSETDRESWIGLLLLLAFLLLFMLVVGLGNWMLDQLVPMVNRWLSILGIIFASSFFVHLVLLIPAWVSRKILSRIFGLEIVI